MKVRSIFLRASMIFRFFAAIAFSGMNTEASASTDWPSPPEPPMFSLPELPDFVTSNNQRERLRIQSEEFLQEQIEPYNSIALESFRLALETKRQAIEKLLKEGSIQISQYTNDIEEYRTRIKQVDPKGRDQYRQLIIKYQFRIAKIANLPRYLTSIS